jgi:hypothetical protein
MNPLLSQAPLLFLALFSIHNSWASPIQTWRENTIRQPVSQSSPNVNWSIQTDDAALEALAQSAVQQWQDVDSAYITFTQVAPGAGEAIEMVILSSISNAYAGGQAITSWNADGEITQCTIELLASALTQGGSDYAQMILAHEFGHCLGLAHSIAQHAVMSYRDPSSTLTADDRFALTLLYPEDGTSLPVGCASISNPGNSRRGQADPRLASSAFTFCFMLLGMIWLRRNSSQLSSKKPL